MSARVRTVSRQAACRLKIRDARFRQMFAVHSSEAIPSRYLQFTPCLGAGADPLPAVRDLLLELAASAGVRIARVQDLPPLALKTACIEVSQPFRRIFN